MSLKKTALLKDAPTKSDAFGTHKRIAALLHQEIVRSDEGRSIALVGDWGSGKSTVIEILKDQLDGAPEFPTAVFIYDAWSHQGDSLRRAFLDDFIASLTKFLSEEQRLDAVRRVWNRTETTTTTREPILRRHAKILLLSLSVVPLGMQLFQFPSNDYGIQWTDLFLWNNILALVLIATPVFFALIFGVVNRWIKAPCVRKFLFGDAYKDPHFSVLSFFFEKVHGNVERREIKSPVDSIATFREVFSQIVNDVHSRQDNLRIVIIIDNIDRIPVDEAREFWSTMQTFFSDGGGLRQPKSMKYWLIAPFSVEALSFIFGDSAVGTATTKSGAQGANKGNPETSGASGMPKGDTKVRAKAYVDKTFGLSFYVPPPILSNWRRYLLDCLTNAFVEHDHSDLAGVRDVYDFGRVATGFVTPRDIKIFVNSLVALYRQRGDEIPLTMMASYLLHREEIGGTDIPDDLIATRERRAIGVTDWRTTMAALHFGVPLEEGAQLLLHEPLVQALREGSGEKLRELEGRPGFSDVFRKVVVDELGTSEAGDGTALAQFAEKLGTLEYAGKPEAANIWADIGRSLGSVHEWSGLQESPVDGIAVIIGHTKVPERLNLCKAVAGSLSKAKPSEAEDMRKSLNKFAMNWTLTAKAVVEGSGTAGGFEIKIPDDAKCALEIVKQLAVLDIQPPILSAFKMNTDVPRLSKMLAADIGEGNTVSSPDRFTAYIVQAMQLQLQWPEIGRAVSERMNVTDLSEIEVRSHLGLLLAAYGYGVFPNALKIMKDLSHQGHLSRLYHRHRKNQDVRAVVFAATLLANPSMERQNQPGESQQGDAALNQVADAADLDRDLISNVASVVQRSGVADALYRIGATNPKVARLIAAVIGSLGKSEHRFGIEPEAVVEHWAYIEKHADLISAQDFLTSLKEREDLLSLVASRPFDAARVGFYRVTSKVATDQDSAYWTFLEDGISTIGSGDWSRALTANDEPHAELIELVKELREAGRSVHLQVPAKDAVLAVVRRVVNGEQATTDELRERLAGLIGLLNNGSRASLVRDIADDIMSLTDADQLIRLVEIAGQEITLEREVDPERIVRRIFSPLVSKPTDRTTAWIKRIVEGKRKSFWLLPDESRNEFALRLEDTLGRGGQLDEALRESLVDLAVQFNINLRSRDMESSESQSG